MSLGLTVVNGVVIEAAESVAKEATEWASDTGGTVLNAGSGERFQSVVIQVSVTFHASAVGDCLVHLRKSADGATTENTTGTYAMTIPITADSTIIKTIEVYDFDYLDVGLENEDADYAATWSAKYEGIKLTGMATS